jgi:hypothetical protein
MAGWSAAKRIRAREGRARTADPGREPPAARLPWRRWAAEVAVIFLGVFFAAVADDLRERRNERQTATRLAVALKASFDDLRRFDEEGIPELQRDIAQFEQALEQGRRPPYLYRRIRYNQRPPTAIWEAFLAAGGARLFPPDVVFDLARFYSGFNNAADREQHYYRWIESEVLPAEGEHPAYVPGTTRLRPLWRENYLRLKEQTVALRRLADRTHDLERRIFASLD